MPETPKLTDRQQQILDLVQSAIERTGAPPTRAEIAAELGFRSANAAEEHLQALARKGVIELVGGTSRGIRLQSDTLRALNQARGKQFVLPLPSLAQLALPLVGRVAAGSPILAQEHIDRTFLMEASMFSRRPDYLLKVRGMSMRDVPPTSSITPLRASACRCSSAALAERKPSSAAISARVGGAPVRSIALCTRSRICC